MCSFPDDSYSISLYSAGQNNCFQLGRSGDSKEPGLIKIADYGDLSSSNATKYLNLSNITSISCGNGFTLAVLQDGTAYGWGYNENGCLSFSDRKEKNTPRKIDCVSNIKMVSCGDSAAVFLSKNNENNNKKYGVYMTDDSKGLIKIDNDLNEEIEYVFCSYSQQVWMIGESGAIYQYSQNTNESNDNNEEKILKFSNPNIKARKISAGSGFAVIINENDNDELYGTGKMTNQTDLFVKIESMAGYPIEKVVSFNEHCIVLTKDHKVFVWGKGTFGCLGLGNLIRNTDNNFIEIESLRDKEIVDIGAGNSYSCFISANGDLYSCGLSKDGRTMMGDTNDRKVPEKSKKISNAKKVYCGSSHTIVLCSSKEVTENPNSTEATNNNLSQNVSEKDTDFLTIEQMRIEVDELRKENRIIKEENYRLRSANLSLEAENNELQKTLEKVTKKKIVEGCMSDAEYSNPIKMFNAKEINQMKRLQQTNTNQFSEEFKVESTTHYTIKFLKKFNNEPKKFKHYLNKHSQVLTTLHPCINRVIGYSFNFNNSDNENKNSDSGTPCIITESHEKTLENFFSSKDQNILNNTDKAQIITQIILGLRYLHSMNISHKNINPSSIFLTKTENKVKIADIGLSEYNSNQSFISPELSEKMKTIKEPTSSNADSNNKIHIFEFDKECDVFAFGCLVYYILSGGAILDIQQNLNSINLDDDKNKFNDTAKEIIQMCCIPKTNSSVKKRPDFNEIFDKLKYANFQIAKDVCAAAIEKTVFEIEYFEQKQLQIKQRFKHQRMNKDQNTNPNQTQTQNSNPNQDINNDVMNNKSNENNGFYPIMPPSFPFDGELPAVSPRIHIRKPPVFRPISGKASK